MVMIMSDYGAGVRLYMCTHSFMFITHFRLTNIPQIASWGAVVLVFILSLCILFVCLFVC